MAHITTEQRYAISVMLEQGYSQQDISTAIKKDKSVVSREISRNCNQRTGKYNHELAQRKYRKRIEEKPKFIKFDADMQSYVNEGIRNYFSPEQISGRAKVNSTECVSTERIYQYVWQDKRMGGDLHTYLRSRGKRYRKRGSKKDSRGRIPDRFDIDLRPAIVDEKKRFGDLEIDTVMEKNHIGALVTINDRMTGYVKIVRVPNKESKTVTNATIKALLSLSHLLYTITSDNGKEFAGHREISEKLKVDFFFAHPYHSWERGANENTNGLIRQYFPKKTDFTKITDEQVQWVENILNNRPRKKLEYLSPIEFIYNLRKVAFVT